MKPETLILAPMAELTHTGFRILASGFGGCDLYFTEMISSFALVRQDQYKDYYLNLLPYPSNTIVQLVGSNEEDLCRAAEIVLNSGPAGIDINMGCCAPELVRKGCGIAWMKDPDASRRLVAQLRRMTEGKTLSVKLRIGYEDKQEHLLNFCRGLAEEGIDFITLHPRLKADKFLREPKWEYVKFLNNELRIPVIGNGDISSYHDYAKKTEAYSPPGIMIGRAAIRSPWIFKFIKMKKNDTEASLEINLEDCANRFLDLLEIYQPAEFHVSRGNKFFIWFAKNFFFSHEFFKYMQGAESISDFRKKIQSYFLSFPQNRIKVESA